MSDRWIVFGLGNAGDQYATTRHNVGQIVIDYLANGAKFSSHKSKCVIAETRLDGAAVTLAKSTGYMNDSGAPIKALADFYKVPADHLIVIHDEIDIPFNTLRIKIGGSDNGHNGLKSITKHFATGDYYRTRVGVDRPQIGDPADYVLKQFSSAEKKDLPDFIARSAASIERLIEKGLELTQQEFNK